VRTTFIEDTIKIACPTVRAVPRSGRYRFSCYVAIEKMNEGEAKLAAMAVFVATHAATLIIDHLHAKGGGTARYVSADFSPLLFYP
jgi:hypothetical protein